MWQGQAGWDDGLEDGSNEDLPAELVQQFHFGGFERKQGGSESGQPPDRRSKKEVSCGLLVLTVSAQYM